MTSRRRREKKLRVKIEEGVEVGWKHNSEEMRKMREKLVKSEGWRKEGRLEKLRVKMKRGENGMVSGNKEARGEEKVRKKADNEEPKILGKERR